MECNRKPGKLLKGPKITQINNFFFLKKVVGGLRKEALFAIYDWIKLKMEPY